MSLDPRQLQPATTSPGRGGRESHPLVSILINNYNYAPFLGAAIDSALAQTYDNIEVIVVDDGSTDSSRRIIRNYGHRVTAVFKQNGGQASAFNAAFAASRGDILCFLDADDVFLPEKIEMIVQIFRDQPDSEWCFDRVQTFDHDSGERQPPARDWRSGSWDIRSTVVASGVAPHLPTATSGLSFCRSALALLLPMPEMIRITADSYLKLAAISLQQGWMASGELTLQRIHRHNAYTGRSSGKRPVMALTGLLIGIGLYEQFPALRRLAITTFARGLGLSWIARPAHRDCNKIAAPFLRQMNLSTRLTILSKALHCSTRTLLSDSRRAYFRRGGILNPLAKSA
jgi:glycosyltransferase involved in cell wall biosynthesis